MQDNARTVALLFVNILQISLQFKALRPINIAYYDTDNELC